MAHDADAVPIQVSSPERARESQEARQSAERTTAERVADRTCIDKAVAPTVRNGRAEVQIYVVRVAVEPEHVEPTKPQQAEATAREAWPEGEAERPVVADPNDALLPQRSTPARDPAVSQPTR